MRKLALIASFPIGILAMRFLPLDHLPAMCAFYQVTGRPCPTCGMTRAVIALTHLDFRRSMAFHPLAVIFTAALLLIWGMAALEILTGRRIALLAWLRSHTLVPTLSALGLLLIYGVFRMAAL